MTNQSSPTHTADDLRVVIEHARDEAAHRHGNYVDVEHLLLGLLRHDAGPVHDLLARHEVDPTALYDAAAASVGMRRAEPAEVRDFSRQGREAMDRAAREASALGHSTLGSGHLLLGLMGEPDGAVHEVLAGLPFAADDVRAELRARGNPSPSKLPAPSFAPPDRPESAPSEQAEIVLVPFRPRRQKSRQADAPRQSNRHWIILGVALLIAYLAFVLPGNSMFTFVLVLGGWVFSVTLHEFAHAFVAYLGGDHTVKDKGYLSFNPLKYTHPMLSIGLPLLFLALGGIGLPGGAVYIERHRLRSKWWGAAVSAAGPAANLLLALVLAAPFALGLVDTNVIEFDLAGWPVETSGLWENSMLWSAVAFLAMLQITAVFFNLLPIPPLDGFGILEPFLDARTRNQLRQLGTYGLLLIFIILWTPLGSEFWSMIFDVTGLMDIPGWLISEGFSNFMFWRNPPQ